MNDKEFDLIKIGRCIKKLRESNGWSQADFADQTIYSEEEIREIEAGIKNIEEYDIIYIGYKFDVYPSTIIDGNPMPKQSSKELSLQLIKISEMARDVIKVNDEYIKALERLVEEYSALVNIASEDVSVDISETKVIPHHTAKNKKAGSKGGGQSKEEKFRKNTEKTTESVPKSSVKR